MTKTQIQVPEELMNEVKELASKKEWSFAEACRRGLELLLDRYPLDEKTSNSSWELPPPVGGGWKVSSDEELNRLRYEEQEPGLK